MMGIVSYSIRAYDEISYQAPLSRPLISHHQGKPKSYIETLLKATKFYFNFIHYGDSKYFILKNILSLFISNTKGCKLIKETLQIKQM